LKKFPSDKTEIEVGIRLFCQLRLFCIKHTRITKVEKTRGVGVKTKEVRDWANTLKEYASTHTEKAHIMHDSMCELTKELQSTRKLWRKGNNSILIKAGLALIAFPDPILSDILGAGLVAAGLIQTKIKNSVLHVEDVYKTFPQLIKELNSLKQTGIQ